MCIGVCLHVSSFYNAWVLLPMCGRPDVHMWKRPAAHALERRVCAACAAKQ